MLTSLPYVSIIVPALNEERFIGSCLNSLAQLRYPEGEWEVIVVDNGSRDHTVELARSFAARLNLTVLQKASLTVSGLRNLGARVAKGSRLIFLDADCVASPEWLEQSVKSSRNAEAVLLGARFRLPETASWVARVWWQHEQREQDKPLSYLSAHNLHISRDEFLRLGGFDEQLNSNEDYEFSQRILAAGQQIRECPELSVVHLGNAETLLQFFRRERWHGRDVFGVFLRNIRKRYNLRAVAFAVYTLLSLIGVAAGIAAGFAWGDWRLCVLFLSALIAAPVALNVRAVSRLKQWRLALPLGVLFFVYGLARAVALFDRGRESQRKLMKVATT